MKLKNNIRILVLVLTALSGMIIQSCQSESNIVLLELEVAELVCGDGQRIFEGRILELAGIKSVSVNIHTQKAQIRYRDNQVTAETIEAHLKDFGFTVGGVVGNAIARSRLPSCCFEKE